MNISEIEQSFKDIFEGEGEESLVQSIETVYELADNEEFYRLVISVHGLSMEDTIIIHTKFIFRTDLEKRIIIDKSFIYLYDINCVYHKIDFDNSIDMEEQVKDIVESSNFGEDLKILSDFIEAPAMFLNYYMRRHKITDYSIFEVKYEPKFKTTPCDKTTFDFDININNNYDIELSIQKIDVPSDEEKSDSYQFHFKFMDEMITEETDSIRNIHYLIGSNIAQILDKKLK